MLSTSERQRLGREGRGQREKRRKGLAEVHDHSSAGTPGHTILLGSKTSLLCPMAPFQGSLKGL